MHTLNTLVDVDGVQDGPRRRLDATNTPSRGSQDAPRRPSRPPRRYEFPTCSVQPQVDVVHGSALVISYNAAISACQKCEQWQMALSILRQIRWMKLPPDLFVYGIVASMCEQGGQRKLVQSLTRDLHGLTAAE